MTVAGHTSPLSICYHPLRNIGAKLLADAAEKANEESGDGTTSCTVIAHSVLQAGAKYVGL